MADEREPGKERAEVLAELRGVKESVRERALGERTSRELLPPPEPVALPGPMPADPAPPVEPMPVPPDNAALNQSWDAPRLLPQPGLRGLLVRLLRPVLVPSLERQRDFNSLQVRFDNELIEYLHRRLDLTHRHYDTVLGVMSRHLGEIDERHLIIQRELVTHVHDLVARIDLVLSETERSRVSLESALREVRERLGRLEEGLTGNGARPPASR